MNKIGSPLKTKEIEDVQAPGFIEDPIEEVPEIIEELEDPIEEDTAKDIEDLLAKVSNFEQEKADLIKKHQDEMTRVKEAIKKAIYNGKTDLPTKE